MSKDAVQEAVEDEVSTTAVFRDTNDTQVETQTGEGAGAEIQLETSDIGKLASTAVNTQIDGSASKKSNVEVGQQDIKNECKGKNLKCGSQLAHLETSLATLEEKIMMYSVQNLQEKVQVDSPATSGSAVVDKAFSLLEKAITDIKRLQTKVNF
ncbi:uncharacterized protein MELLADRAFT_95728 [Melampsora larici-populina 98AG31]|uniref:Uncharacterized protein n=1 Tax=Melampsora larici-populina (strain 98AG31 / pathotype 3-4-7) TaxID=747676 RepID=F4SAE1_MELLP|nr:uncharacterized protein MELLADRAFT_95728 [Melampsora larici-populina 98AG31]EGF98392.1 hypothetical protein MELLADRAFT_95728 [Melampsora larici-populina 98AG31]